MHLYIFRSSYCFWMKNHLVCTTLNSIHDNNWAKMSSKHSRILTHLPYFLRYVQAGSTRARLCVETGHQRDAIPSPSSSISSPRTPRASWRRHPKWVLFHPNHWHALWATALLVIHEHWISLSLASVTKMWVAFLSFCYSGEDECFHFLFPLSWKFPEIQEIQVVWVQFENEIIQSNNSTTKNYRLKF